MLASREEGLFADADRAAAEVLSVLALSWGDLRSSVPRSASTRCEGRAAGACENGSAFCRLQPADVGNWYTPMHDFDLHMRIIEALRKYYPGTHISLHAGRVGNG